MYNTPLLTTRPSAPALPTVLLLPHIISPPSRHTYSPFHLHKHSSPFISLTFHFRHHFPLSRLLDLKHPKRLAHATSHTHQKPLTLSTSGYAHGILKNATRAAPSSPISANEKLTSLPSKNHPQHSQTAHLSTQPFSSKVSPLTDTVPPSHHTPSPS